MSLDKKTLRDVLGAGDFSDPDKVRLAFENLDQNELRAALDAADLSEPEKKRLMRKYSSESRSSLDIEKLSAAKRWIPYLRQGKTDITSGLFWFTHKDLLTAATKNRPKVIGNRVTDFSGWVLSLYYARHSKRNLTDGKKIERKISEYIKSQAPPPDYGDWKLIYRDAGVKTKPAPYKISKLTVNDEPLWGAPDFVFRSKATRDVLIVELKASRADIPSDGWPNLRAQLWAYAQVDELADAPRIILIGEIWCEVSGRVYKRHVHRWEHGEAKFERENSELFELYRGTHAQLTCSR